MLKKRSLRWIRLILRIENKCTDAQILFYLCQSVHLWRNKYSAPPVLLNAGTVSLVMGNWQIRVAMYILSKLLTDVQRLTDQDPLY
jgi:hypothetical protein